MKKLFLLDAYALIFRAYFAFARNPRVTSKGLDTSAVYGFLLALLDVMEKEKPSHLAVVFDVGGSEVREQLYPAYKAHRDETPEGTRSVLDREAPGLAEAMRSVNPLGRLSRGLAGLRAGCVIINTPGSPKGCVEQLSAVLDVLEHAVALANQTPTEH